MTEPRGAGRGFDVWHCNACHEDWTIVRGKDEWEGECPSCGSAMVRVGLDPAPTVGQDAGEGAYMGDVKVCVDGLATAMVDRYQEERREGVAHHDAWNASVRAMMKALNDVEMLASMEAAHRIGGDPAPQPTEGGKS